MPVPTVGGLRTPSNYIPLLFSKRLLEVERDNTLFTRLVNRWWEGELKQCGDTVIIRREPEIVTDPYTVGGTYTPRSYDADSEKFTISRARSFSIVINDIKQMMSDLPNWTATWTANGAKALAEFKENEFFASMASEGDKFNVGTEAGRISRHFNLGATTTPLLIVDDGSGVSDSNKETVNGTSLYRCDAVKAMTYADAVLAEQKAANLYKPWIVIPTVLAQQVRTSKLFVSAADTGDSKTLLRQGLSSIGSIGRFDVYESNNISITTNSDGTREYDVIFGDERAVTYCDQIAITEVEKEQHVFAQHNHSSLSIYDWKCVRPEHLGHMIVTF